MATYVPPKANVQFIFYSALVQQADTRLLKSNPTIAAGDFKTSLDGAALGNLGTLPTVTPASSVMVKYTLSTGEMNGANATVVSIDAAGAEWCDRVDNFQTAARQIDDLMYPATSGRSTVVDASGLVDANTVKLGPTGSGTAQTARDIGASVLLSSGAGTGQLDFTSGVVKANATQWLGGTIPAVNVTGVPLVDCKYLLGTIFSTPATAGIIDVNLKNIANAAVSTSTAQLGVNAVNWGGGAIPAPNVTGVPLVDLKYTLGTISPAAAGSVRADAVTGAVGSVTDGVTVTTNNDKSGYSLTQAFPANFSALAITAGGAVTAGTVSDKTGYALTAAYDAAKTASQAGDAMTLTAAYDYSKGTVAMTEAYSTKGATVTPVQAMYEMLAMLQEFSVAAVTATSKKRDQATTAMTHTLDAANPSSITRTT